jgi:cell division protein FtsI (penicillin-binding protein 3)
VINGGIGVKPYLIKEVRDRSGKIIFRGESSYKGRVITRKTSAIMRRILTSVVTGEGTGTLAKVKGYTVGGKTGTSQKVDMEKGGYSDKRIASFIGFFPADRPLMTVLVLIDEPQDEVYGGLVAAPIFSKIVSKVAIYGGLPPDERQKGIKLASTKKKEKQVTLRERLPVMKVSLSKSGAGEYVMPDLEGLTMAQVIEMIEYLPLEYSFQGSGVVLRQYPPAGKRIRSGITCRLVMGEN